MKNRTALVSIGLFSVTLLCLGATAWPRDAVAMTAHETRGQEGGFHEILKLFVGRKCFALKSQGGWGIQVDASNANFKLDMLGDDFLRLDGEDTKVYVPFSAIRNVTVADK